MRLGMHGSDGMAVILGGALEDDVERLVELLDRLRFARLDLLDLGNVADG